MEQVFETSSFRGKNGFPKNLEGRQVEIKSDNSVELVEEVLDVLLRSYVKKMSLSDYEDMIG